MVRKAEIKTVEGLRGGKGKLEMHHILKLPGNTRLGQGEHGVAHGGNPVHQGEQVYARPNNPAIMVFDGYTAHGHADDAAGHIQSAQLAPQYP